MSARVEAHRARGFLSFKTWSPATFYCQDMADPVNAYVARRPHPRLRPFVQSYSGYKMSGFDPGLHTGLPSSTLTMIVSFDDKLDVELGHGTNTRASYWSMVAGLHSQPATIHHLGHQHGLQLEITPRGAQAVFGVPARTLARQAEQLDAVAPSFADELVERVSAVSSWRSRWAILDEIFLRVLDLERPMPAELERAWSLLVANHGSPPVAELAEHAGWSRRHFTKKFTEHYGLSPKLMARVLRFERANRMIWLPTRPSLASVAAACGYADQAHMTRDWVEFAGAAPTVWMADETISDFSTSSMQDPTD